MKAAWGFICLMALIIVFAALAGLLLHTVVWCAERGWNVIG